MTRGEVLERLRSTHAEFEGLVQAIPRGAFDRAVPGGTHSPKQIVEHVTAYEELIVARLRAAALGETTAFDRDRDGWEKFNDRVWAYSSTLERGPVLERSAWIFLQLLEEVAVLTDSELNGHAGVTAAIDPAWLAGRTLAELIGIDAFDHYPMHFSQLKSAAAS